MDRLIGKYKWSLIEHLNTELKDEQNKIVCIPYIIRHDNNIMYYNNVRRYNDEGLKCDPFRFGEKYNGNGSVPQDYADKPFSCLLDMVYEPLIKILRRDINEGFRMLMKLDHLSTRAFLRSFKSQIPEAYTSHNRDLLKTNGYPETVVSWLETMDSSTGLYDQALTETIMDTFDFEAKDWVCIEGGSGRLIDAITKILTSEKNTIVKNSKVTSINSKKKKIEITLNKSERKEYDHVISTIPLSKLRVIDTINFSMSYQKRIALRTLHYDHSVKIVLRFKNRWWQHDERMGDRKIFGGQSKTDLPIRTIVYPSYGIHCKNAPGILIVSYTWAQDAARIGNFGEKHEEEIIDLCLRDLATIHGDWIKDEYIKGKHFFFDWYRYEHTHGAFALFGPSQFSSLYPWIVVPEANGRLHFAGEATSVHHGWIIGGLNSAYRSVWNILEAEGLEDKQRELIEKWGKIDEIEYGKFDSEK
jgi:monoamine oxidase